MSLTLWQPKSSDAPRLKDETIVAILGKLHARYGAKWADQWRGVPEQKLVAEWASELAGFTPTEIRRGLDSLRTRQWPPTLPEFQALCRPPIEAESAYHEAMEGLRARSNGKAYQWSHPAIYWAAVDIGGHDLTSGAWAVVKSRWTRLLARQLERGEWAPIPAPPSALLEAPPKRPCPPELRERLGALLKQMGSGNDRNRTNEQPEILN